MGLTQLPATADASDATGAGAAKPEPRHRREARKAGSSREARQESAAKRSGEYDDALQLLQQQHQHQQQQQELQAEEEEQAWEAAARAEARQAALLQEQEQRWLQDLLSAQLPLLHRTSTQELSNSMWGTAWLCSRFTLGDIRLAAGMQGVTAGSDWTGRSSSSSSSDAFQATFEAVLNDWLVCCCAAFARQLSSACGPSYSSASLPKAQVGDCSPQLVGTESNAVS